MSYEETVFWKYDFLGGPFANIKGQQIRKLIMPACSLYLRNIDIGISENVHPGGWLEIGLILIWGPELVWMPGNNSDKSENNRFESLQVLWDCLDEE